MDVKSYKTEGIIIKRQNSGEADRILTIFSKHQGKLVCLAKGARKPTSRKSGHIELFDRTYLFLSKGKYLDILTQAEVRERFANLRGNLKASKAAFQIVELIDQLLKENQESSQIYSELVKMLRMINRQQFATKRQIADFEQSLLVTLGFGLPEKLSYDNIKKHIENIIEKNLKTAEILKDV